MKIWTTLSLIALLAARWAPSQVATGPATGYLVLNGKLAACAGEQPYDVRNAVVYAMHKRARDAVRIYPQQNGLFRSEELPLFPERWTIKATKPDYAQAKDKRDFRPIANYPNAITEYYICLEKKSAAILSFPETGPFPLRGFGSAEEQSAQAANPVTRVIGQLTTESGTRVKGRVALYGIHRSKIALVPLAFDNPAPGGEYHLTLAPSARADFDYFFFSAKGPGKTSFTALLAPDELTERFDAPLTPDPPEAIKPLSPGDARGIVFRPGLMRSLPLSGSRDINNLVLLAPGVLPGPETTALSGPGIAPGVGTAGEFSVNGMRSRQNNFILDGADNTDDGTGVDRKGFVFLAPLPAESVAELQTTTGSVDARFGRGGGAQIFVLSSTGAEAFHGAAYGYFTDRRFNAHNFFDSRPSSRPVALTRLSDQVPVTLNGAPLVLNNPVRREPPFTRGQAGFAAGGPIARPGAQDPRTYFFAIFEDQTTHAARQTNFSVPTVAQRGYMNHGDTGIVGTDQKSLLFPSSPIGNAIFSLYPFPNNPTGPFGANTYSEVLPGDADGRLYSLKLDRYVHAFRASNVITVRYSQTGETTDLPAVDGALLASVGAQVRTRSLSSFFSTNFAARWANTARFGWGHAGYEFDQRLSPLQSPSSLLPSQPFLLNRPLLINESTPAGPVFRDANTGTEPITGPVGRVNIAGFSPVGIDSLHFFPQRNSDTFQWADTATRVTGRQTLAVGFEMWRLRLKTTSVTAPEITFPGLILLPELFQGGPAPAVTGRLDAASVVAAGLVPAFQQAGQNSKLGLHRGEMDFFLQDDFRISSRLTLHAGGRLIIERLPMTDDGRFERPVDPALFDKNVVCKGLIGVFMTSCSAEIDRLASVFPAGFQKNFNAQTLHSDIRAGFAWSPFGRGTTVLRFGFGIYTSQLPAASVGQSKGVLIPTVTPCSCGIQASLAGLSSGSAQNPLVPNMPAAALAIPPPGYQVVQPAPNLGTPSSRQYNLGLQRLLPGGNVVSLAYVGTMADQLPRLRDHVPTDAMGNVPINAMGPPGFILLSILPLMGKTPDFFSARVGPGKVSQLLFETTAKSRFDSLQFEYRGSVKHSLQFGTAFTWAHSTDDASDFFDTAGSFALPQNNAHLSERGPSSFDVRLRGTGYFVWDLPRFSKGPLLNGWQLDGVVTAQTGQPFTVNTVFDINGDGLLTDRLATTTGLLGPALGRSISGAGRTTLLALAPGASPANLLATPPSDGAVGRNSFRAGGMASIDLALSKTFAFRERYKLAWRVESFNSANRSNFGVPVRILEAPAFGQAFRTVTPNRTLQIGGTFDF